MQLNDDTPPIGAQAGDATASPSSVGAALLLAAMALPLAGPAQAESAPERGTVALKYLDYLDSQPGLDRIAVRSPSFLVTAPLGSDWSLTGTYVSDVISGASPAFHDYGIGKLHDHRKAGQFEVTNYRPNGTWTLGTSLSSEDDYLSRGVSAQYTRSNESKNTTWLLGWAYTSDVINPVNHRVRYEHKHVTDVLVGVTQVFTADDIAQFNLGFSWGNGYYSDPYKVVDNRPRDHDHATWVARWNHFFDATQGTSRASYRYYTDNWGIRSHTVELEYVQPLAGGWTLTPAARVYTQTAARFYVDADPSILPFAPNPPDGAIYYSEDTRLSALGGHTLGFKIAKQLDDDWTVDFKVERYEQRAEWTLFGGGSPGLLPFRYRSYQLGVSRQF
jgi:hypothetical protein